MMMLFEVRKADNTIVKVIATSLESVAFRYPDAIYINRMFRVETVLPSDTIDSCENCPIRFTWREDYGHRTTSSGESWTYRTKP